MAPSFFLHLESFFLDLDWTKIVEAMLTTAGAGYGMLFLSRRQQKWREKIETRSAEQKSIDQMQKSIDQMQTSNDKMVGRVGLLETQMSTANQKIEDLRNEKMELQAQIISLRQQIALLEVKKAEFEAREAFFTAHVADLEQRLFVKTEELRCAEQKLKQIEERTDAQFIKN